MNILINASNLRHGGGIQVADSIFRELYKYPQHMFVVVYPSELDNCAQELSKYENINCIRYDFSTGLFGIILGRNSVLDQLVEEKIINVVLTIFGPSIWKPRLPHVCGFARAQIVLDDSPFWDIAEFKTRLRLFFRKPLLKHVFRKSGKVFWTESSYISYRLKGVLSNSRIYTITNNYNQIFDHPGKWDKSIILPNFDGFTLLTVSANYPHKNLGIILPTIHHIIEKYPDLKFRFVLTINEKDIPELSDEDKKYIVFLGPVSIEQCPYLYEQSDVMLLPTLLECFSASYAEAMKMAKPILTTDLGFAKTICGDAAYYYDSVSAESLADAIYRLSWDKELKDALVNNGKTQLSRFDTFEERTRRMIEILEFEYHLQTNGNA